MPTTETREQILEAARRVIEEQGLGRATTRQIARAAGCAEGTLYVHFKDKAELFLCVLRERLPEFIRRLEALPDRVGKRKVRANLEEVALAALAFFRELIPMSASIFAEPDLLARHREALRERNVGPHLSYEAVADYLRAEQRLGRVSERADPYAAAVALLGAGYHYSFVGYAIGGDRLRLPPERLVKEVVRTLSEGLAPREGPKRTKERT